MALYDIIANIIPENFLPIMQAKIIDQTPLLKSGAVYYEPVSPWSQKGFFTHKPFYKLPTGTTEKMTVGTDMTANEIDSDSDTLIMIARGIDFKFDRLEQRMAGINSENELSNVMALLWAKEYERYIRLVLKGLKASAMAGVSYVKNVSTAKATLTDFRNAKRLLGDAQSQLKYLYLNQQVKDAADDDHITKPYNYMKADYNPDSIDMIADMQALPTDAITETSTNSGVWTSTLLGQNSIWFTIANQTIDKTSFGNKGGSTDHVTFRSLFCIHIPGTSWAVPTTIKDPTDTELSTGSSWEVTADSHKHIPVRFLDSGLTA